MNNKLIEKYLEPKKKDRKPKAPEGYEWDGKMWRPIRKKKKKTNESSGNSGSTELWFGAWNKRSNLIYIRNEEVLFSSNAEFPIGSPMKEEDRKRASARGYILLDW